MLREGGGRDADTPCGPGPCPARPSLLPLARCLSRGLVLTGRPGKPISPLCPGRPYGPCGEEGELRGITGQEGKWGTLLPLCASGEAGPWVTQPRAQGSDSPGVHGSQAHPAQKSEHIKTTILRSRPGPNHTGWALCIVPLGTQPKSVVKLESERTWSHLQALNLSAHFPNPGSLSSPESGLLPVPLPVPSQRRAGGPVEATAAARKAAEG